MLNILKMVENIVGQKRDVLITKLSKEKKKETSIQRKIRSTFNLYF